MYKVLVVDDEPEMVTAISNRLSATREFTVDTAGNGDEAISRVFGDDYDCIILDLRMSGKSGFEVCSEIRGNNRTIDIPIIISTCHSDDASVKEAIQRGATDFLKKPFYGRTLLEKVRKWSSQATNLRARRKQSAEL